MKAVDWVGVVTIVGGVVMFLLGLESGGQTRPWNSAYTICLIVFGLVVICLFFINEWRFAKYPLMPLRLFSNRSNIAALGVCYCHGLVFIAGTYYLPLYFQTVLAANPILSGVYLLPLGVTLSLMSAVTGIVIKKTGHYREPIWFGLTFMVLGFGLFLDLPDHADWTKIIIYQIIAGIGVGPNFQAPLIALQNHVKGSDIATATSLFGFMRQLATSMSVVLGGVIFQNMLARRGPELGAALGSNAVQLSGSGFGTTTAFLKSLPSAQKAVVNMAYTQSLHKMWIFYVAIGVFGLFISLFIRAKVLSKVHEKTVTGLAAQEVARLEWVEESSAKRLGKKGDTATGIRPNAATTANGPSEKRFEDV